MRNRIPGGRTSERERRAPARAKPVLALVCIILVTALAPAAGCGSAGDKEAESRKAREAIEVFLESTRAAEYGKAYDLLCSAYKKKTSREKWISNNTAGNPELKTPTFEYMLAEVVVSGDKATANAIVSPDPKDASKTHIIDFALVRENGKWKVNLDGTRALE